MTWTPFLAAMRNGLAERANQVRIASNRVATGQTTRSATTQATAAPASSSSAAAAPKHVPKETPKNMQDYEFLALDVSLEFL